MAEKNLNKLLQWSIANSVPATGPTGVRAADIPPSTDGTSSTTTTTNDNNTSSQDAATGQLPPLDPELINALLGGPSDADLMKEAMRVILDPETTLENKEIAIENLEMLVQQIDNANNLDPLKLWEPLLGLLSSEEELLRGWAALCVSTAVQNNEKAQKKLVEMKGVPPIVKLATSDPNLKVRKRAILAVSSAVRNCQEALDVAMETLPSQYKPAGTESKVDASDMEAVDGIIHKMRAEVVAALQGK